MSAWLAAGPRFLPFADAATPDLPLSRLLRLSLIQVSAGLCLVLLVGTLNRVMIVELGLPAAIVAVMISLPLAAAPFRALIGHKSDTYASVLGWKRVPFIYRGTMLQFGGLALMPFALLVLAGAGQSGGAPAWIGQTAAAVSFLLVGAGVHVTQTVGLALATDLAPAERHPQVVGLMYVMLLVGMIASALAFGALLEDFSHGRLVQVIQGAAVVVIALNAVALWKQEALRRAAPGDPVRRDPSFLEAWRHYVSGRDAPRRLLVLGLGTMAFSMQDVLLEPYGGEVLGMTVAETTRLTATLAAGGLAGLVFASHVLARGADPFRVAALGTMLGAAAFTAVIAASPLAAPLLFAAGVFLIGAGGGLFGHGTLTATMTLAPSGQAGLALGAWGAVQASAAGLAVAAGGILRDAGRYLMPPDVFGAASGYTAVYTIEIALLLASLVAMAPLVGRFGGEHLSSRGPEGRPAPFPDLQTKQETS